MEKYISQVSAEKVTEWTKQSTKSVSIEHNPTVSTHCIYISPHIRIVECEAKTSFQFRLSYYVEFMRQIFQVYYS